MEKKKKMVAALLILVVAGGYTYVRKQDVPSAGGIKTARLSREIIGETLSLQGIVLPKENIKINALVSGAVEELYVKVGDVVKAGDELVVLSSSSLEESARVLAEKKLEFETIEAEYKNFSSESRKVEIENSEIKIREMEANIKKLKKEIPLARIESEKAKEMGKLYEKLYKEESISSVEANAVALEAVAKERTYEDLRTSLDITSQQLELAKISLAKQRREKDFQEEKLKSTYEKLAKEIPVLEKNHLDMLEGIKAPRDGIVTSVDTERGNFVSAGQRLMTIASGGENIVKVDIPVYEAAKVKADQYATINFSDSMGIKSYKGKVLRTASVARQSEKGTRRVIEGEITLDSPNDLKPGYTVGADIKVNQEKDALTVGSFSVFEEGTTSYIYVVENGIARKRRVSIGSRGMERYEVLDLPEGTEIVLNPFKVRDGEKIRTGI